MQKVIYNGVEWEYRGVTPGGMIRLWAIGGGASLTAAREDVTGLKTIVTEAQFEQMLDRRVWRELARDRAYLNAQDADTQNAREEAVENECERALRERYEVQS